MYENDPLNQKPKVAIWKAILMIVSIAIIVVLISWNFIIIHQQSKSDNNGHYDQGQVVVDTNDDEQVFGVGKTPNGQHDQGVPRPKTPQPKLPPTITIEDKIIHYKNASVKDVMQTITYIYNIPVEYQGKIPEATLTAMVNPKNKVESMIKMLEWSGVKINYDGKRIVVLE